MGVKYEIIAQGQVCFQTQPEQSRTCSPLKRTQWGEEENLPVSLKHWKSLFWDTVQHFLHPTHTVLHHHIREGRVKEAPGLTFLGVKHSSDGQQPHPRENGCTPQVLRDVPAAPTGQQSTYRKILLPNEHLQLRDQTWKRMGTPQKISWRCHRHDREQGNALKWAQKVRNSLSEELCPFLHLHLR